MRKTALVMVVVGLTAGSRLMAAGPVFQNSRKHVGDGPEEVAILFGNLASGAAEKMNHTQETFTISDKRPGYDRPDFHFGQPLPERL